MTRAIDIYTNIAGMDLPQLHARRAEILSTCDGKYAELADEPLAELCAIAQALRRKAATPGGGGRKKVPKAAPTVADVL